MQQTRNKSLGAVLALGLKSIGEREKGFFSRWGWSNESWSGVRVNQQVALQNDTVWACVRKVSDSVAGLPLFLYRRSADGGRALATDHRLYDVIHNQPNARMSAITFWQSIITSMLLWGNGFARIERTGTRIISLEFLDPARMALRYDSAGAVQYLYTDVDQVQRTLDPTAVLHIPAFSLDGQIGISAIQYGVNSIGSAIATERAADETFKNAGRATGIITMDYAFNKPEQRDQVRDHVKKVDREGGVYVLEKGAGYQSMRFNPVDAELLSTRSFSVETICRWFDMPPVMIGHGDKQSSWPTSVEAQNILFLRYVLRALITRIEQAIRRQLLTPAERLTFFAEYALEGFLRGDSAARAAFYTTALQNGWMTRNEVRRLENLPPVDGGDVLTVQSNMIALDQLGKAAADPAAQVRNALTNWLAQPEKQQESTP